MTIKYANGTMIQAVVVQRDDQRLRVAANGSDDVAEFTCADGTWLSEDRQPVQIEFQWQKRGSKPKFSEKRFICSRKLASRLIRSLVTGSNEPAAKPALPRYLTAGGSAF